MLRRALTAAPLLLISACVLSEVTHTGKTKYPALPAGCPVEIFTGTAPPYPVEDLATDRAKCHMTKSRSACIDVLKADVCKVGGDTLYAFRDGIAGEYTIVVATIGKRKPPPPAEAKEAKEVAAPVATGACDPICSPGFACSSGICVPQCNPPCDKDERCGKDRLCHPTAPPAASAAPASTY